MDNVMIEDVGPCKKHIKITVPKADIEEKVEESYKRLEATAIIDGFRKGHVPRKLLERRFGEEVIEDVKQSILADASKEAVEEHKLRPLGDPSFDNVDFAPDKDCVFEVTLEVEPEFELKGYKGLNLKKVVPEVTEEAVARGMESLRMRRATLELMPEGTPVAADDWIVCDWVSESGGESVASENGDELRVGGRRFGGLELEKDISETLDGAKFGETREAKAEFMETYPVEKWRGKEGLLKLTVREIRRPLLPELNEAFAKQIDFESLDELKEGMRRSIRQELEREAATALEQQLFDQLLERMPFGLPERVMKAQARSIMLRHQFRMRQRGVSQEEMDKHLDELRGASEDVADRNLKIHFILDRIAEKEKIFVTENEVQNRIAALANGRGISAQRMRAQLDREGSLSELRAGMREDRVIEFLMKSAEIEESGEQAEEKD